METSSNTSIKNPTRFSKVTSVPTNKIFDSMKIFESSTNPNKLNLAIGMLFNEDQNLIEFQSVKMAEKIIHEAKLNKEYPPIQGLPEFNSTVQNLFFSPDSKVVTEERILTCHTITGGAALRVCAEVILKFLPKKIYLSNLTWGPYKNIFSSLEIEYFPYYNSELKKLDLEAFLSYIEKIENGSIINLQLSSHNPTALDFTPEQWDQIVPVFKNKKHFAVFDAAYLGYGTGSIEKDIYPIKQFAENNIEMMICYSSAKNFANFSDDVGALIVVLNKKEPIVKLKTHLVVIARSLFSFVSLYGSRIVSTVLGNEELREVWKKDLQGVIERILKLRLMVIEEIERVSRERGKELINLEFLRSQGGIYMFLDINEGCVDKLAETFSIFLCEGGRLNLCGLQEDKVKYFVESLKDVLLN
jgi:aspartate/tyrosine/aromatic aminotransferase